MKPKLNPNRKQRAIILWLIVLIFVLMVVVIGLIAYVMIKCIKKIVPPPPPKGSIVIGATTQPPPNFYSYDGETNGGWEVPLSDAGVITNKWTIQRCHNLGDEWLDLFTGSLDECNLWNDTNSPPADHAFYRLKMEN